jgi:hypothetical protein
MIEAANQVNNAGIEVKEQLVALLLVNCLPKSYQQIASMILTTHVDLTKLKPSDVRPRIIEEESRRVANRTQISCISKAPQLKKYCEKYGKDTNHTTEQHWEKGKRFNSNNNNGQSGSSGSSGDGNQGRNSNKKKKKKGKGKGQSGDTINTVSSFKIVDLPDVTSSASGEYISVSLYAARSETAK